MRVHRRSRVLAALTAGLVLTGCGLALADTVTNTLDDTVDVPLETMSLTAGGEAGTTSLVVRPAQDGENGCNLKHEDTSITVTLASGDESVARLASRSVTLEDCGTAVPLTVVPLSAGTTTVHATGYTATGATSGRFDIEPVAFTVTVAPAPPRNTAPRVSVTGVDAETYEIGDEPTVGCDVEDDQQPGATAAPRIDRSGADEHGLGTVTVACEFTDEGGLSDRATASYEVVDTTAPTITAGIVPAEPDGADGWYVTAPTVSFTCADEGGSGVVSCPEAVPLAEGADQTVRGEVSDHAGNTAAATVEDVDVDLTSPTAAFDSELGSVYWGRVPAVPTCTAHDDLSGPGTCTVSGYGTEIGEHTLVATAYDVAGNVVVAEQHYTVLPWTVGALGNPVAAAPAVNSAKGGSTVPVKFRVLAGAEELTDVSAVRSITVTAAADCTGFAPKGTPVPATAAGGSVLRYDAQDHQFVFTWKPAAEGCAVLSVTAADGSTQTARFSLRK
ncbi:PxKF domain-containing protein [Geodermatophilus sp. SYSU D01036]